MESPNVVGLLLNGVWILAVIVGIYIASRLVNSRLLKHYEGRPHLVFRRQLIQMAAVLVAALVVILLLPLSNEMRGQLLSLFGIIISATIALSSTTLVGNVMAGIMLRMVNNIKPGDYVTVGDYFGRISEMDLLHVEVQTEQRDLTTLPNLYLVTHPVRVMQSSGTILSVELSLGYDCSRHTIEQLLLQAASDANLEKPYVQIKELGDFSVTYVVSGLLSEVNRLIAKRRELRARTVDVLHEAGIEIVSPTFMNTRAHDNESVFIPTPGDQIVATDPAVAPDSVVFDKAEKAETLERLKENLQRLQERKKECEEIAANADTDAKREAAQRKTEQIISQAERLEAIILKRESQISSS